MKSSRRLSRLQYNCKRSLAATDSHLLKGVDDTRCEWMVLRLGIAQWSICRADYTARETRIKCWETFGPDPIPKLEWDQRQSVRRCQWNLCAKTRCEVIAARCLPFVL